MNTSQEVTETEKPLSPWMVGLLVVIFGSLGVAVSGMNLYLGIINLGNVRSDWTGVGLDMNYIYFSLVVGMLVSTWMMYIGFQLLGYKDRGRRQFDFYLVYFVFWTLGTSAYQYLTVPEGFARQVILNDMLPEFIGKLAMLGLFLVCRYLLNRKETRDWLK
ncbi:MAG: hypothetical protein ACPGSM_05685 [Thiolinea sp.]